MNTITKCLWEGKLLREIFPKIKSNNKNHLFYIDEAIGVFYRNFRSLFMKISPRKIVFMTFQNQYTCNPKYIAEELVKCYSDCDVVWIVNQETLINSMHLDIPQSIRLIERNTYQSYIELATAKVWVDNSLNCISKFFFKKKGQIYMETWHGSLGIKKLETYNPNRGWWKKLAYISNYLIDFMFTNSTFEENIFKETFWPNVKMIRTGHARNDIFFSSCLIEKAKRKVCEALKIQQNLKLVLYAPTFRDRSDEYFEYPNFEALVTALNTCMGREWKILVRLHNQSKRDFDFCADYIIDVTGYPDMQELMAAAEIGITDYSSWIYDFILTERPGFIYAPDLNYYDQSRGFYYPLEDTPFSIAKDTDELIANIRNFQQKTYLNKIQMFLTEKGCVEDGHASKAITNLIIKYL